MKILSIKIYSLSILIFLLLFSLGIAQPRLTEPRPSPYAEISQTIGLTEITIKYHRPAVNDREIWGKLVPYDQVWRAGANENTTISFSDPVKINGKDLPAGEYGLHMIPGNTDWTIIFSNVSWAWGSFSYDEKEDALRIVVNPEQANFTERLRFQFDNPSKNAVTAALYWEKIKIPFKIEVDVHQVVLATIRKELRDLPQFFWQGWNQAASYCQRNNINHQEALDWAERSISMNKNFTNLNVKAGLLEQTGRTTESEKVKTEAFELATENEINQYGYQKLFADKIDEAIEIFRKNVQDYPDSWNVYDSLGEGYAKKGDFQNAVKYYSLALEKCKNETQRKRITGILETLQ